MNAAGPIVNVGSIGGRTGAYLRGSGAALTNEAGGVITGAVEGSGVDVRYGSVVNSAGFGVLSGRLDNEGVIDASGGTLAIADVVSGGGFERIGAGGTLELAAGAAAPGAIVFSGGGGTLQIDGTIMPSNPIGDRTPGEAIELRASPWNPSNTAALTGNTLTMTGGTTTDILIVSGAAAGTRFTTASDGLCGTVVEESTGTGMIFSGSYTSGIVLSNSTTTQNPATVASDGTVIGDGVRLTAGGTIDNTGLIVGAFNGVEIDTATASLTNSGTIVSTGTLFDNAVQFIFGTVDNSGTSGTGVALNAASTLSNSGTIIGGGTAVSFAGGVVDLDAGGVLVGAIAFTGSGGTLKIDGSAMPANTIYGFAFGEAIDLPSVTFTAATSATFDATTQL